MALFGKTEVTFALDTLRFWSIDDRYGGVEPYVIPVFFKVDGERYLASLRINHSQHPRPGSSEEEADLAGGQIQIGVDSVADKTSPYDPDDPNAQPQIKEDNPFIFVPTGDLLTHGTRRRGEQIVLRDIAFRTTLSPIPFRIDISGTYKNLNDALDGLLVPLQDSAGSALNFVFDNIDNFIGGLFGLSEVLDSCPATDFGASDFLREIDAQLKAMIPATIGGVFLCMENDEFDEDLAQELRSNFSSEVAGAINDVINGLNDTNLIPDVDRLVDQEVIKEDIKSKMKLPVIADVALTEQLAWASSNALFGVLKAILWGAGGEDDPIGVVTMTYDQSDLGPVGSSVIESDPDNHLVGGDNRWELTYTMSVHSVS